MSISKGIINRDKVIFVMIRDIIHQEMVTIINGPVPVNRASKP